MFAVQVQPLGCSLITKSMQSWDLLIWYVQNRKGKLDFLFWQKLNRMGKRKHKGLSNSHIFPYKIKRFMWLTENNAILTKDNPIIDTGWGLRLATSVMRMNQWTIFAFNVVLLKQFGESLGYVSMQVTLRKIFNNIELRAWISKWLSGGETIYTCGCAAVCWAIWKCRNLNIFTDWDSMPHVLLLS